MQLIKTQQELDDFPIGTVIKGTWMGRLFVSEKIFSKTANTTIWTSHKEHTRVFSDPPDLDIGTHWVNLELVSTPEPILWTGYSSSTNIII